MMLFKVSFEYKDVHGAVEWEERMQKHLRRVSTRFDEPRPEPKRAVYHAAVYEAAGGAPLKAAADLALLSVVGSRDCWERYEVVVLSVEYIGSVAVESEAEP